MGFIDLSAISGQANAKLIDHQRQIRVTRQRNGHRSKESFSNKCVSKPNKQQPDLDIFIFPSRSNLKHRSWFPWEFFGVLKGKDIVISLCLIYLNQKLQGSLHYLIIDTLIDYSRYLGRFDIPP